MDGAFHFQKIPILKRLATLRELCLTLNYMVAIRKNFRTPRTDSNYNGDICPYQEPLLMTQIRPNLKGRFLGPSLTHTNHQGDICLGNICPYQDHLTCY